MERIAPLAKILAEANGIDWEKLSGTGEGGMIVEQDILNYLSRVMTGEEDPPSTPVDAPPPDWNGEDIPGGGMFDANMLKGAGVEEDIATFVTQTRPAASSAPSVPAATPTRLEEEDFELDDEPVSAPAPVTPAPAAAAPVLPVTPDPVPAPVTPEPAPATAAAGLGSLLSRLYHKDPPAPPATPEPAPAPVVAEAAPAVVELPRWPWTNRLSRNPSPWSPSRRRPSCRNRSWPSSPPPKPRSARPRSRTLPSPPPNPRHPSFRLPWRPPWPRSRRVMRSGSARTCAVR